MTEITKVLAEIDDDPNVADKLLPLVYEELRKLAVARLVQEQPDQTLTATALAHEAFLRLVGGTANFYHAICQFQQDKNDEAQIHFTATEETIRPLPTNEHNPHAKNVEHDDLALWIAYKEAKSQLAEPETLEE